MEHFADASPADIWAPSRVRRRMRDGTTVSDDGSRHLTVLVTDDGSWLDLSPEHDNRGRGIPLMRGCTDATSVLGTATGIRVAMTSTQHDQR
ncbi:MAG: hypothetical protein M3Z25_02990 [Actinomycetota bacterium]|nr:hypothetical protein [Actinomycetota bacterium]